VSQGFFALTVSFDLLITDLVMPQLHGTELAARLVARRPALRVMYISGYAEHASLTVETLAQHTLLAKPFTGSELARIVRAVLDQTE
jgi:two-component SAPR family response regulator